MHAVVPVVSASSQFFCSFLSVTDITTHHPWLKSKQATIHIPYFTYLVAELMEQVHAGLVRLAMELESVRGQVQTECNALRDLFARTATMEGSQHDRRLHHKEADRHLPQRFGGSRDDHGDFAFRMNGYAAVLSRDGQGGALLMEVAKLEKFEATQSEPWR